MAITLYFNPIQEDRGWYFVEYRPPQNGDRFATLSLTVLEGRSAVEVADAMEQELLQWHTRYPLPLLVSAFDEKGDLFRLNGVRPSELLFGYKVEEKGQPSLVWKKSTEMDDAGGMITDELLRKTYAGVPYRTSQEVRAESQMFARQLRIGWAIVFVWTVVTPAAWAIFEWAGPAWVGAIILVYSLWRAVVKALKLLGLVKESAKEARASEKQRRMEHHHYHCERNPDGFLRLKLENFERDERESIKAELAALREQTSTQSA